MTTRRFDPVFSAALRNELEALADAHDPAAAPALQRFAALRRPQVWVAVVTAVVLVAATIGVLHLTSAPTEPAGRSRVVDPLTKVTDPSSPEYVARAVQTLLHISSVGPGGHDFSVPAGVTSVRVYLNCAPSGQSTVDIDGKGRMSGGCSRDSGSTYDMPIKPGTHEVEVTVGTRTDSTLLLMASPAPTVSPGALIDPLTQVRDRRDPDALVGDTTPVLRAGGSGAGGTRPVTVTPGARLRLYFVCRTTSSSADVVVAGHTVSGCMNSIAHWFDFTPTSTSTTAQVDAPAGEPWSLLVVPAPVGAKDSPANATLPYPTASGTVLAEARGSGAPASGTYRRPGNAIAFTVSCRGNGWLEIMTGDGGTNTRGTRCSALQPNTTGFSGEKDPSPQHWTVLPHGDISWTFQLTSDG
ncbi:MAG: hypothetical protein HIU86_07730 [Acidobacteria bacterium]|nr:hypothetical protein [Acidobacteriota bacterium]